MNPDPPAQKTRTLPDWANQAPPCPSPHLACVAGVKGRRRRKGKKEKKGTPATKSASFAFRPLFQLYQLSLQRPIRIRRVLFCMTSLPSLSNPLSITTSQLLPFLTPLPHPFNTCYACYPRLALSKEEQLHKMELLLASQ